MATMTASGYKWLYDATRAKVSDQDRVMELLEDKGLTSIEDVKKNAVKYGKKVKVVVRSKNGAVQLSVDGKKVASAG